MNNNTVSIVFLICLTIIIMTAIVSCSFAG